MNGAIGETGLIKNLRHELITIDLKQSYQNPVVFVQPLSYRGSTPAIVRLTEITDDSFTLRIQEPSNADNRHTREKVSYIVLEAGNWELEDGTLLEVGKIDSNAVVDGEELNSWETIDFNSSFENTPAVFSQVQTVNGRHFVRTRQQNASASGVQIAMEEQDSRTDGHVSESIAWLAITPGSGAFGERLFEVGNTGDNVTHNWHSQDFNTNFDTNPTLLTSIATYNDGDPVGIRYQNLDSGKVELRLEEDTTADDETEHSSEVIDFLAINGRGLLFTQNPNTPPVLDTTTIKLNATANAPFDGNLNAATDEDGDILTYEIVSNSDRGDVTINPDTGEFVYTPEPNFSGEDSFTYRAFDGTDSSETATVELKVTLFGTGDDDNLSGDEGDNIISARGGNDNILGAAGNDSLNGGSGSDVITGGEGDDNIVTGGGNDVVVFTTINDGFDTITDFTIDGDRIDINTLLDSLDYVSIDPLADGFLVLRETNSANGTKNTRIDLDPDGKSGDAPFGKLILLENIDPNLITYENTFAPRQTPAPVNQIIGTAEVDSLTGLSGNDFIVGLGGNDRIDTGAGEDIVLIESLNDGYDRINDFDITNDQIDISGVLTEINYNGTDPFGDEVLRWRSIDNNSGMHSRLDINVGGNWENLVQLRDLVLNDLNDSSFLITESLS